MISLPPSSCREKLTGEEEEIDEYRVSPLLPPAVKGVEIGVEEEEKRRSVLPFRPSLIRPSIPPPPPPRPPPSWSRKRRGASLPPPPAEGFSRRRKRRGGGEKDEKGIEKEELGGRERRSLLDEALRGGGGGFSPPLSSSGYGTLKCRGEGEKRGRKGKGGLPITFRLPFPPPPLLFPLGALFFYSSSARLFLGEGERRERGRGRGSVFVS